MRRIAWLALLVLLAACSSGSGGARDVTSGEMTAPGAPADRRSPLSPGGAPDASGATDERGETHRRSDRGRRRTGSDPSRPAAVPPPVPGTYVYAQEGFEELCRAGACDRQALPKRQIVDARVRGGSGRTVVVTVARSGNRTLRTVTSYGPSDAVVTELGFRISYGEVHISRRYKPQPPVVALRFPPRDGARWAGRWEAETSGSYRTSLTGPTVAPVARRLAERDRRAFAWRVNTLTAFRGELTGRAHIDTWIDARTGAVVALQGTMDLSSAFGDYHTTFEAHLARGPGYR